MRSIVIVLGLLAVAVAGLTAILINRYIVAQKTPVPQVVTAVAPRPEGQQVLIAAADIKPGAILKAGDLDYRVWPSGGIDSRLIRKSDGADPKAEFVGQIARRAFLTGEPLSREAVFKPEAAGVMAGMLSPGMRAVSLPVTHSSAVSGFILPNDRIDILLNQDVRAVARSDEGSVMGGDVARFSSEVVLADVRVIAVDDKLAKPDGTANLAAKTLTVEVSPKDAETLTTAAKLGDFTFALRSMVEDRPPDAPPSGYTPDLLASRSLDAALRGGTRTHGFGKVLITRAGKTTSQSFAN